MNAHTAMPAIERAPAVFDPAPRRVSIRSAPAAAAGDGFTVLCGAAADRPCIFAAGDGR